MERQNPHKHTYYIYYMKIKESLRYTSNVKIVRFYCAKRELASCLKAKRIVYYG